MTRKIVLTSFGSYGDLFPYLGIAVGLRARGHNVVLATSAHYRGIVENEGIGFHPLRPDVDPRDRERMRRIMDPARGTEFIIRDLILGSLRDTYADLAAAARGADLIVSHPITFAAPIIAEQAGIPWVSCVLAPISFFSAHDLPVFAPIPWAKRLERLPGGGSALLRLTRSVTGSWADPVRELRRDLGLPPGADPIYEGQHSPYLVLALFSSALAEPQPDWPPHTQVTGPITYNNPSGDNSMSPRLTDFLDAGPPPIVFTLGTSAVGAARDFYSESVEAVSRLGARAVLLVGNHPENHPGTVPDHVLLEPYASHAALFPRASLIVHQGGAGTLHQALLSARPTLVVPFAHDQPDNAYRLERLGVSRTVPPGRYRAGRIVEEITTLREPRFLAAARSVAALVRAEDGVDNACTAIETVLAPR